MLDSEGEGGLVFQNRLKSAFYLEACHMFDEKWMGGSASVIEALFSYENKSYNTQVHQSRRRH